MAITRKDIRDAWTEALESGCGKVGDGIFIEKGSRLNAEAAPEEDASYDDGSMYITTDDGIEPIYVTSAEDAIDELHDQIRDIELRYAVLDWKEGGDQYETILPADATEADGIAELDREWSYLTDHDRKGRTLELVRMACLLEDGEISTGIDEDEDRKTVEAQGWDWYGAYTPIATRRLI